MNGYLSTTRVICSPSGVMKRPPRASFAILTNPGQRSSAPQRCRSTFEDHDRSLDEGLSVDRVEVLLGIETQSFHHKASLQCQPRSAPIPDDGTAYEILDGAIAAIGPHDEHAGTRIGGGYHLEPGWRPILGIEKFLGHLAEHQTDVGGARFEQRDIVQAAAGRQGLYADLRVRPFNGVDEGAAIDDKAAAFAAGGELQAALLRNRGRRRSGGNREASQERPPPQTGRLCRRRRVRPHQDTTFS